MKIVHISSGTTGGGASIAALRLHQSLMKKEEIESAFVQRLQVEEEFAAQNNIYTANTGRSLFIRARKKYNLHVEHFNWVRLNKEPKNYEIATFATTSYRIEQLPIVKEADIIHLHWVAEFLNYPTFFKNIKQPIVWTLHDINPFSGLFHFELDRLRNISTLGHFNEEVQELKIRSINQSNDISVVCLSDWMRRQSKASRALGRYPHYIIPNGLDLTQYPSIDKQIAKKQIGVDNQNKTLLVVGSPLTNQHKGFPLLFSVLNKIGRNDFNLITVGDGAQDIKLNENINHIHFDRINDTSELNKIYSAADITVIPSKEDNLPNVMLESFANGTPIIGFSNSGMAEHITTGKNGILANKIGTDVLTKSINDFLDNKYTFNENEIRNYAKNTFSDITQTDRYIELYNKILNK